MKPEAKLYVPLGDGKCGEIRISIVEEGLPVPHEVCCFREPTLSELEAITGRVWAERFTTQPPFPIDRPARSKPLLGGGARVPDPRPDQPARTAKPWWLKPFSR